MKLNSQESSVNLFQKRQEKMWPLSLKDLILF